MLCGWILVFLAEFAAGRSADGPWPAADAQYFAPDGAMELGSYVGAWRMRAGDDPAWAAADLEAGDWPHAMMGARMKELDLPPGTETVWLRRRFFLPADAWVGQWLLRAKWAAGDIRVFINGRRVGRTAGSGAWRVPVPSGVLRPGVENWLALRLHDPQKVGNTGFTTPSLTLAPLTADAVCAVSARVTGQAPATAVEISLGPSHTPLQVTAELIGYDLRSLDRRSLTVKSGVRRVLRIPFAPQDRRRAHLRVRLVPDAPDIRPGVRDFFPRADVLGGARHAVLLNGTWKLAVDDRADSVPPARPPLAGVWQSYPVPHWSRNPFAEKKPKGALWFRRRFRRPAGFSGERIALVFEAVRYRCDVYLNGALLGSHSEGYSPFEFDITGNLRPDNELVVRLLPLRVVEDAAGRRLLPVYYPPGIWQDVWLVSRPMVRVKRVQVLPSLREKRLDVRAWIANESEKARTVNLRYRVLQNGGPELPPVRVTVPPGAVRAVSTGTVWPDPRLYWPRAPYLYTLAAELKAVTDDTLLDRRTVRFGFREVRLAGREVLYNGRRLVLRKGPWAPGGHWTHTPEQVYEMMSNTNTRAEGTYAVRFHHSPPPPYYLDAADLCGVPVEEESAVFGGNYAWDKPEFWRAFREHWSGLIARDANHPAIVLYSIENESYWDAPPQGLASAGGSKRKLAEQSADIGQEVSRSDPTRPVNYEGDGDLDGFADIENVHYPNWISADPEFPARTRKRLDDHGKPLIVGEFAYELTANPPRGLTSIMGRAALRGRLWRMGYTEAVRQLIEGYKLTGVDGYSAWDAPRVGTDPPLAVIMDSYCRHAWAGERFPVALWLVNSTLQPTDAGFEWRLLRQGRSVQHGRTATTLQPNRPFKVLLDLAMPAALAATRERLDLELRLLDGAHLRYRNVWALYAYRRPDALKVVSTTVVYDPGGSARHVLRTLGARPKYIRSIDAAALRGAAGLLIAPNCPPAELAAACRTIERFVLRGGRVAILRQTAPLTWLPDPAVLAPDYRASIAFPCPGGQYDPVLAGLDGTDLRWWRPDGRLTRSAFLKSGPDDPRAVVESGGGLGLVWAPLMVFPRGAGAYLACQLLVTEKAEQDPAANLLLRRIVSWLAHGRSGPRAGIETGRGRREEQLRAQPVVSAILPAENAITVTDVGVDNLPPAGVPVRKNLVTLQDPGDGIAFVVPGDMAAGEYRIAAWVRTGEKEPTDRVGAYEVRVGGARAQLLRPGRQPPLFSHRGGDWAVWYGYGEMPGSVSLKPGERIVVTSRASWLYIGHLLLKRRVPLRKE